MVRNIYKGSLVPAQQLSNLAIYINHVVIIFLMQIKIPSSSNHSSNLKFDIKVNLDINITVADINYSRIYLLGWTYKYDRIFKNYNM